MNTKVKAFLVFFIVQNMFFAAAAQDEGPQIKVIAQRIQDSDVESSRSVTIINAEAIQFQKAQTLVDVLRSIPGVDVVRQGAVGQTTSVFLRGARSEDTLVLIDGVEMNDAMSPAAGYDFSLMSAANIARIEVFRGPQSIRFGGGALGGVINIITTEGEGPFHTNYLVEGGTYKSLRSGIGFSGKKENGLGYSLAYENFRTEGFSAASEKYGNTEVDGAAKETISGKLVFDPTRNLRLETALRYNAAQVDMDAGGGPGADDPNAVTATKEAVAMASARLRYSVMEKAVSSKLSYAFSETNRKSEDDLPSPYTSESRSLFLGENYKLEINNEIWLSEELKARLDVQSKNESGGISMTSGDFNRKSQSTVGEALSLAYENESFFADVGGRIDQNTRVKDMRSSRVSVGLKNSNYNFKAYVSYGTGFKLPSLYQLYDAKYGEPTLKPENSKTTQLTLQAGFSSLDLHSITFFDNGYENMMGFVNSKYINVEKAKSKGFEFESETQFLPLHILALSYTYLEAINDVTGERLLRRPMNSWTAKLSRKIGLVQGYAQYKYKGERIDIDPISYSRVSVPGYSLTDLGIEFGSNPLKFYTKLENIFNTKYEEVAGYGTAGQTVTAGVSGEF